MRRTALIACLTATLLTGGCLSRQPGVLASSEDPHELVARIAEKGQSAGSASDDEPSGSPLLGNCLKGTRFVGECCLGIVLAFVYALAQSNSSNWGR